MQGLVSQEALLDMLWDPRLLKGGVAEDWPMIEIVHLIASPQ